MKKSIITLFILIAGFCQAQEKGIIEGIVLDKQQSNSPLAFVHISLKKIKIESSTNIDGAFAFEVKPGIYTLIFNFPGYEKIEAANIVVKPGEITSVKDISLAARVLEFSEIKVTPKKEK